MHTIVHLHLVINHVPIIGAAVFPTRPEVGERGKVR